MASNSNQTGQIFTKESRIAHIQPNANERPVFERDIRTYRIDHIGGRRYRIYELYRKKKSKQIMTITGDSKAKIIRQIQANEIILRTRYDSREAYSRNTLNVVQANYHIQGLKTDLKDGGRGNARAQIVAVVRVTDDERNISDYFVGYSSKIPTNFSKADIDRALIECEDFAILKFIKYYGIPPSIQKSKLAKEGLLDFDDSGTATGLSGLRNFETEIIEYRFQYYVSRYKTLRTKKLN